MFFRVVPKRYKDRTYEYLQLIESYRDGDRTRQRVIHSFGNLEHIPEQQRRQLVRSLQRALGLDETTPAQLAALDTRRFADVLALRRLWQELELPAIIRRLTGQRAVEFDLELVSFLMVAHRLIDPGSKLALTRWLPQVHLDGHELDSIQVQHCYRALDILDEIGCEIEEALFVRLSDLFARELSVVFYDLTSTYFEGDGPSDAAYGYSRDRRPDQKQILIALAVDRRGLPISHLTFPGNLLDHRTLEEALGHLRERFEIGRTIFVADGGVMTGPNVERLTASGYRHVLALPKGRALARELAAGIEWAAEDVIGDNVMARAVTREDVPDLTWLVCYNPERAEQEAQIRQARLDRAAQALGDLQRRVAAGHVKDHHKILGAAAGALSRTGAKRYFTVHSDGDGQFEFELRRERLAEAARLDGYYFLQTDAELEPAEMLAAYKTLQQGERGFRHLKDVIRLRPIYHWADRRVRGHVFVCMLAYLLERTLELRLEAAGCSQSAAMALGKLEPIRVVRNQLGDDMIDCVVQRRPAGAGAILQALGLAPVPVVLTD